MILSKHYNFKANKKVLLGVNYFGGDINFYFISASASFPNCCSLLFWEQGS